MSANENYVYGANKKKLYINNSSFYNDFKNHLRYLIKNTDKKYKDIVVICIGTDRSTGDSFAPLIGTMLSKIHNKKYKVVGTLQNPVHAKNLVETIESINKENTLIIAVDACLGQMDSVESIIISEGGLKAGSGVGKEHLPIVGDISIAGVVNFGGFMDFLVLQNTRLGTVYSMSEITCKALHEVICELTRRNVIDIIIDRVWSLVSLLKTKLVLN